MKKLFQIAYVASVIFSTNLFCAEAAQLTKAAAAALSAASQPAKCFSYKVQPSNQITAEEASEHATLINSAFEDDGEAIIDGSEFANDDHEEPLWEKERSQS